MNCKEATELVSQNLDRHLGLGQRIALRLHLLMCNYCRNYSEHLAFLHRAAPQIEDHIENQTDVALSDESKAKIKQSLNKQG
jgi:predicted anti-sigma-YlaC factor YlaD